MVLCTPAILTERRCLYGIRWKRPSVKFGGERNKRVSALLFFAPSTRGKGREADVKRVESGGIPPQTGQEEKGEAEIVSQIINETSRIPSGTINIERKAGNSIALKQTKKKTPF